ncbi:LOW QUALITY PROTEIN: uncharacterized protein ACR2FA_000253 [Aphomia sociella]
MSAIKVNFEIGHVASLRSKKTPEGFTHDWEVFVRGQEGADISHFVDRVVFILHDTFPKPKRVVKEPPFSLKESGYAGFIFPIEIYLKNKDEPKKIQFSYDFSLQQSGFLKDRYIFQNPNEDFRKKLLKGGGIPISNNAFYTNPDQESRSRDSFSEDKQQLISKPKMSSENVKKHKSKEHKEEIPHRTSSFETLFGPPIHKPPKISPEPKKVDKSANFQNSKSDKKDKERMSSDKKSKHEHKEAKTEKMKVKEEKEKVRSEKVKSHNKDQERSKDKATKRPTERPPSPETNKKRCVSPIRKPSSPPPRSSSATSFKEEYKASKHNSEIIEQKKPKLEEKAPEVKVEKDLKEKKKKEKSHDRDKERKEKREHKKESHKSKESPKELPKEIPREVLKPKEIPKEKDLSKEIHQVKEKQPKLEKNNKFSIENLRKTPPSEIQDRVEPQKIKDKSDLERKHKHKKKDKKRDESREKHKESSKEKKHKHEKIRDLPQEKPEAMERRETPVPKERPVPEPASPISIDTASQCSSKSGLAKTSHLGNDDINSSHSDSESSVIAEEEEPKIKIENPSPEPLKCEPSPELEPEPEPEPEPEVEPEPEPVIEPPPQKEKSKKHKDKASKREEKRRKRKAAEEEEAENRKMAKSTETALPNNDIERGESSGTTTLIETKVQDNGVSSSLGEDAEPGDLSPEYMGQLRDLQKRIMTINNNEDLERVVNLIAETGRYEVTTQTFDFDLCLLDRSTVQQLIQLVGC